MSLKSGRSTKILRRLHERDPKCWLCMLAVDWALHATKHPGAPTLDHVIPLSRGGTDEQTNLRLAHAYCNHDRGNGHAKGTERQKNGHAERFEAAVRAWDEADHGEHGAKSPVVKTNLGELLKASMGRVQS